MKKILMLTLIITLSVIMVASFSIAGCKTTATTTAAAETTAAETTAKERTDFGPVVCWIPEAAAAGKMGEYIKYWDDLSAKFYEQTKIKVICNVISWADAINKYNLASLGADPPDCTSQFYTGASITNGKGKYGPVNFEPYIIEKYGSIDAFKKQFLPNACESNGTSPFGYIAGIPVYGSCQFMIIRDDLFKTAGIIDAEGNAKAPTNYAELLEDAKKLTIDTNNDGKIDQYGIAIGCGTGQSFWRSSVWPIYNCGINIISADYKKSNLDNPLLIESFQFARDLLTVHKVISPSVGGSDYNAVDEIGQGKAAIQLIGGIEEIDYLVSTYPGVSVSGHACPKGFVSSTTTYWSEPDCLWANSQHKEAAVEWLWFKNEPENIKPVVPISRVIFYNKEVFDYQLENIGEYKTLWNGFAEQMEAGVMDLDMPVPAGMKIMGWEEGDPIHDLIYNLWDPNSGSIEEILKKANDQVVKILAEEAEAAK